MTDLTLETYDDFVRARDVAVVLFYAPWNAGPGAMIRAKLEALERQLGDRAHFGTVNTDHNSQLAIEHGLINVPAVAYYLRGERQELKVGASQDVASRICVLLGEPMKTYVFETSAVVTLQIKALGEDEAKKVARLLRDCLAVAQWSADVKVVPERVGYQVSLDEGRLVELVEVKD